MNLMDKKGVTVASALAVTAIAVTVMHGKATVDGKQITTGSTATIGAQSDSRAVMIVYSGNEAWVKDGLTPLELALDQVVLPPGSKIGAISFATSASIEQRLVPSETFHGAALGDLARYYGRSGTNLDQAVSLAIGQLKPESAATKMILVVSDGASTDISPTVRVWAHDAGIELKGVIGPSHAAFVQTLAESLGATIKPLTTATIFVYPGNVEWARHSLEGFERAFDWVTLPPGQVGAISYATGATSRVLLGPTDAFTGKQLGHPTDYTQSGHDLVQGMTMGLAELSHATAQRKLLVIVGDGNDTNNQDARAHIAELEGIAANSGIAMKAILAPGPRAGDPSLIESSGIPFVTETGLAKGLVEATGGTAVTNASPMQLEGLRIAGEKSIVPDDQTKQELDTAGTHKLVGSFKMCLDRTGVPRAIDTLKPTGAPAYDSKIISKMGEWRYRPFVVDGQAVPVCTAVTFIYEQ